MLEIISVSLTFQNHSYHKSKFVNSANLITGGIYKRINSLKQYTHLKIQNEQLLEENTYLKNILSQRKKDSSIQANQIIDTTKYFQKFSYITAKIIKNEYHKKYNYLLLNKGLKQGVKADQGVINSKGIIGITNTVSDNYTTVLSILNANSRINVKLLNSEYFGTLLWDANDYNILQLIDLPIRANIKIGDTIITGGKSTIFPEGILVGTILNFNKLNNIYQKINVKLFNDMSAIGPVNIITNFDKEEILNLENSISNE